MDEEKPTRKGDLERIGRAYLEGDADFVVVRANLLRCWQNLSRRALSAAERKAWSSVITALRSSSMEDVDGSNGPWLYDESFFRDFLAECLGVEGDVGRYSRTRRAREIQRTISMVLLREWDPIEVRDEPEARDEYDGYVGGVYRLLRSGASDQEIAEHLARVESAQMGLGTRWEALLPVVGHLRAVRIEL